YGVSAKVSKLYDFKHQAQALASLIVSLGINKINVIGHSMGGTIALELYRQFPELIKSLILCESFIQKGTGLFSRAIMAIGSLEKFEKEYAGWVQSFAPTHESSLADSQFFKTLNLADPAALYFSSHQLVKDMPFEPDFIHKVEVPLLWVVGEKSWNAVTGKKMRALNISVAEVKDAGHGMILDQPEHFAKIVKDFLGKI
ncbi:MAG: alpha/beta hydrolase, partial [Desulfitobacterium hafniense]|nr:alpha/beta hydrolase [Desulfitobacterium hafniense]